jgi:receptor protein-tyrosine kinase
LPPNPAELLSSEKMSKLLGDLANLTDGGVVIVDTSPVLAVTDAAALAAKVDGCLIVVDAGRTPARSSRRAIEFLRRVNGTILGAVLNKVGGGPEYRYYPEASRNGEPATVSAKVGSGNSAKA